MRLGSVMRVLHVLRITMRLGSVLLVNWCLLCVLTIGNFSSSSIGELHKVTEFYFNDCINAQGAFSSIRALRSLLDQESILGLFEKVNKYDGLSWITTGKIPLSSFIILLLENTLDSSFGIVDHDSGVLYKHDINLLRDNIDLYEWKLNTAIRNKNFQVTVSRLQKKIVSFQKDMIHLRICVYRKNSQTAIHFYNAECSAGDGSYLNENKNADIRDCLLN